MKLAILALLGLVTVQTIKVKETDQDEDQFLLIDGEEEIVGQEEMLVEDDEEELLAVIEDQLVRADLIVISGERNDDSFDLITRTLQKMDA